MQYFTIRGTVKQLGHASRKILPNTAVQNALGAGPRLAAPQFETITFVDEAGDHTTVTKVSVPMYIAQRMKLGVNGIFLVQKGVFSKTLYAARIDNEDVPFIEYNLTKAYIGLILGALLSLAFSFVLVGIPFLVACIWGMIRMPGWNRERTQQLEAAGFRKVSAVEYNQYSKVI